MRIRFLGVHNAESKNTRLVSLLVDDVVAIDAGSLSSELTFSEQKKVKVILLSHGHYDHIRAVPAFAFNNMEHLTTVYGTREALDILLSHFVDGIVYPKFTEKIFFLERPALELVPLEPSKLVWIEGYRVLPVTVNHPRGAIGYEITSGDGKTLFYTGDTGPGLSAVWSKVSPQLLIIDVTFSNSLEERARDAGHLCPSLLKAELVEFRRIRKYLPQVVLVHMSPKLEEEITAEVGDVARELGLPISIAGAAQEITIQGEKP